MFLLFVTLLLFVRGKFIVPCDPVPGTPTLSPMGKGRGIHPGRVSWNFIPGTANWDGKTDFYWSPDYVNYTKVEELMKGVILSVSGESDLKSAWESIFKHFNGGKKGYSKGEKIAIKMNFNVDLGYEPTANELTVTPQVFKALISSLVHYGGVEESDIGAYDAARYFQTMYWEAPTGIGSDFPNVVLVDNIGGKDYVREVEPDMDTMFFFSNKGVSSWNLTKLPKLLTEATYVIEMNLFRGHDLAGITASGKNWFGSIFRDVPCATGGLLKNPLWCPASVHEWVNITGEVVPVPGTKWLPPQSMGDYNVLVDLLGHDHTAGKGLLFLTDALYSCVCEEPPCDIPNKFSIPPFNNDWTNSIFASMDPIALDSVMFDFLRSDPSEKFAMAGCTDNYLHEGALADDPPSGTVYQPSGHQISSLGVHEHWNNADDKQYSRNLGKGEGIELIQVHDL